MKLRPFHAVILALALSLGSSFFTPEGPAPARRFVAAGLRPTQRLLAPLLGVGSGSSPSESGDAAQWRAAFQRERALRIAERRADGARPGEALAPRPELEELLAAERGRSTVVGARVIHRDVSALRSGVLVDVGTEGGARVGAAVSVGPVVVGVIVRVFPRVSQVRLLDDPQSRLTAFAIADGAQPDTFELRLGVLAGHGDARLDMSSLQGEGVVEGSLVVTSTRDYRMPPYLVLGEVVEVRDGNYDGVVEVTVASTVDFETLTDVSIWITEAPPEGPWDDSR